MSPAFNTRWRFATLAAALALVGVACEQSDPRSFTTPTGPGHMASWVGCTSSLRFTGGGRVDPPDVGKVTFGFNVDGRDFCGGTGTPRGELQVVYHATQTLLHSRTVESFSSYVDPDRGQCGEFEGTARVKDVSLGSDWYDVRYFAVVCDKAEPGRGADRISVYINNAGDGVHHNLVEEILTGGNIQAHKS